MKLARDKELALLGSLACVGAGSRSVCTMAKCSFVPSVSRSPRGPSLVNDHS